MTVTRIRVQLQEGHNDLHSVTNLRHGMTYLEVAMAVRTLHANTCHLFPKRLDQIAYQRVIDRLCATLERAMRGRFAGKTAGNQFREQFPATREGKTAIYRVDVEVTGPLATA